MNPISFQSSSLVNLQHLQTQRKLTPAEAQNSFKAALSDALQKVNETQHSSQLATEKLARGEAIDLHDVMITAQKASITLQTTVEVRNKVVEAYQEIMRMQV